MNIDMMSGLGAVGWQEIIIRVTLAIFFGLILGIDRDTKNKPIDFRAYMIVALTTCVVALLGQELYADFSQAENVIRLDLAKIIAGTLTGLGFLGAGAIIKVEDKQVIGTATGASIWAAGIMGLTVGFGFYGLAIISFLTITIILVGGGRYMQYFHGKTDKENINRKQEL